MTSTELPAAVLARKAVVYIRQSTQAQLQTNVEGQQRQHELVNVARQRGFREIEVIDEDLGRSASGLVERPGFERLVAWFCGGSRRSTVLRRVAARAQWTRPAPPAGAVRLGSGSRNRPRRRLRPLSAE